MPDERPDFSLENVPASRGLEKPSLFLVKHFQVGEADYMKPPLEEQLLEPDGAPLSAVKLKSACTCNTVCTCIPVSTCACNTVCTCNTVSTTHGITTGRSRSRSSSGSGRRGGGYGGYWAPCF